MSLNTFKNLVIILDCKETEHKEMFFRMTKSSEVLCSDTSTKAEQNSIAALNIHLYKEKETLFKRNLFWFSKVLTLFITHTQQQV